MNNIPGTLLGYATTGAAGGLAVGYAINNVPTKSKDSPNNHNGLIGDNWDFIKTGAGVGGVVALASAGLDISARRSADGMSDKMKSFAKIMSNVK